jgi:hypothetical protein
MEEPLRVPAVSTSAGGAEGVRVTGVEVPEALIRRAFVRIISSA